MSLDIDAEPVAQRPLGLTRIEPATFRGVDCTVLAERYVAYRRENGLDIVEDDTDVVERPAQASSENV